MRQKKKIENIQLNFPQKLAIIESANAELDIQIKNFNATNASNLNKTITNIENQKLLQKNIEICGWPVTENENLVNNFTSLLTKFKIDSNGNNFTVMRTKENKERNSGLPPPVLVSFNNIEEKTKIRKALQSNRIKAQDCGFVDNNRPIYVNDHLTKRNKYLLQQAKERKKRGIYNYVWTSNGDVLVRKDATSKVIRILDIASFDVQYPRL